jgi:hypothetical protein
VAQSVGAMAVTYPVGRGVAAARTLPERQRARRGIEAIDTVLEAIEQHHLSGEPRDVAMPEQWVAWLEHDGGLEVPAGLRRIRDTVGLHELLLDWQDRLFTAARPQRAQLAALDALWEAGVRRAADALLASNTPLVSRGEVRPPPAPPLGRRLRRELSAAMAELVCPFTAWRNPWA